MNNIYYICIMILTLKIKLLPTKDQQDLLLSTLKTANSACNDISCIAWDNKVFNQFKIHKLSYYKIKSSHDLAAQMIVRCISKVANSYKIDRKVKRSFKPYGAISYDDRIMRYKKDIVSLWCIGGRQEMAFICHNEKYLPYVKGEADLIYRNNKFYLFQNVEVPEEDIENVEEFIGVDFGITDIAVTSDGVVHSADWLNAYREKRQKVRSSLQSKGTKGSKRVLKRLSGREKTTSTIINHTISNSIVKTGKESGKGIAIEDLTGIRENSKRRNKKFRTKLGKWNFYQLRFCLTYKSLLNGVPLVVVEPAYTSKTCSVCYRIGNRSGKSFKCTECGNSMDADLNGSRNIATLGAIINKPENSTMFCKVHN